MAYIICKSPPREGDGGKKERRNRGAKFHCTNACPWIKFLPSHPLSSFLFLYLLSPCNEPFKPTGTKFFSSHSTKIHCVGLFGPRLDHPGSGRLKSCPYIYIYFLNSKKISTIWWNHLAQPQLLSSTFIIYNMI